MPTVHELEKLDSDNGFGFRLLHKQDAPHMLLDNVKANSPAWRAGVRTGMYLVSINSTPLANKTIVEVTDFIKSIEGDHMVFECQPGEYEDVYANVDFDEYGDTTNQTFYSQKQTIEKKPSVASARTTSSKSSKQDSTKEVQKRPASVSVASATSSSSYSSSAPSSKMSQAKQSESGSRKSTVSSEKVVPTSAKVTPVFTASPEPRPKSEFPPFAIEDQPHPVIFHHLRKWPQFEEFGFAVHRVGQGPLTLTRVDVNRPAYCSSLRDEMVLCQVNSNPVSGCEVSEVADLIKDCGDEVTLMVITTETQKWLDRCGLHIDDCLLDLAKETYDPPPALPETIPPYDNEEAV